ncbi:Trm112 family protein [Streptomyces albus subsp. chlorinus]|uniref:Trm112 family protein n=1 Tax=Streptomyces albus TaxID=1888 RepID=UPI00156F1473|nr:Trm112 family protein [Streptomyces albus subsp. chlorinus]
MTGFSPDDPLLRLLACPLDKGPLTLLRHPGEALYNPRLRRRYPIVDGIPQLLPSSGEQLGEEEHRRLMEELDERPKGAAPQERGEPEGRGKPEEHGTPEGHG